MKDDISKIDLKISQLKQKKEKMQTQQAILLMKEAESILDKDFSPELVLSVLFHSWNSASQKQKEEWINSTHSFRKDSPKRGPKPQKRSPQIATEDS
jgi:hypothetical protein